MTDPTKAIKDALEAGPTPGPWCVDWFRTIEATGALAGVYIAKKDGGRIAEAFANCQVNTDEQCNANARYIATCNPTAIRSLLSRLEEAERDAERYRWLRDRSGTMKVGDCGEHDHRHFVMAGEFSSFLDQAIDAAMKEQSK